MSGPKTIGFGRFCRPLGRRQGDQAVLMHGQHGDLGHHVLEPSVRLEPADTPAELLLGQRMAIGAHAGSRYQQHAPRADVDLNATRAITR